MVNTEPGGFAEAADGTLVHFIGLDLNAEALHTEVSDQVVLIHGLGYSWHHWSRQIGWIAHARRVVAGTCATAPARRAGPAQAGPLPTWPLTFARAAVP